MHDETVREALRKAGPIGLSPEDEAAVLAAFQNRDGDGMFKYKSFLEILNAVDSMKPGDCTVSIFGVCYAMLMAIVSAYEAAGASLAGELKQRLGIDKIAGEYFEYSFPGLING